ncbi:MAG: AAA family ATPase [Syntrophorhabdaceae bacterium]|nr:AAA family ATPase [Syntrophorhabdaceae bacterium]
MIYSLKVTDPKNIPVSWWDKVSALKDREFSFTPGLNIIWGRNASGKSTILTTLAKWFHCEQGGRSVVTRHSVFELERGLLSKEGWKDGLEVKHDGKPVFYANPQRQIGLRSGVFDDDFFEDGLFGGLAKGSDGQITIHRTMQSLDGLQKGIREIEYRVGLKGHNDVWQDWRKKAEGYLAANSDPGPFTILMDEPDRGLDMDRMIEMWGEFIIGKLAPVFQLIVATHSPFALSLDANYIELSPGYLEKCRRSYGKNKQEAHKNNSNQH